MEHKQMTTQTMNAYEVMFLISQQVASDLGGAIEHINELFSRAGAEVIAMQKWDERRLAFEINKQRRGVYLLAYIHAEPGAIAGLERDVNISERIMRMLVTRSDHLSEDQMRAHDQRDELASEAKLRAERATQQTETSGARVDFRGPDDNVGEKAGEKASEGEAVSEAVAGAEGKDEDAGE